MMLRQYLDRKGTTSPQRPFTPRYVYDRLKAHNRPKTSQPPPLIEDNPYTRGIIS